MGSPEINCFVLCQKRTVCLVEKLKTQGVEGVILGCTEIGLLIKQSDTNLPVFDTTEIHAKAAVDFALASESV